MMTLVIGAAASGKSEYAENIIKNCALPRIYIATMQPFDAECHARIAKHRAQRAEKGFDTVECYTNLAGVKLTPKANVLLECLGNLVANEIYAPNGAGKNAADAVVNGIAALCKQAENMVLVTNDVFADGETYSPETAFYLKTLAAVNRRAAALADCAVEVVCGIPLCLKGVLP